MVTTIKDFFFPTQVTNALEKIAKEGSDPNLSCELAHAYQAVTQLTNAVEAFRHLAAEHDDIEAAEMICNVVLATVPHTKRLKAAAAQFGVQFFNDATVDIEAFANEVVNQVRGNIAEMRERKAAEGKPMPPLLGKF